MRWPITRRLFVYLVFGLALDTFLLTFGIPFAGAVIGLVCDINIAILKAYTGYINLSIPTQNQAREVLFYSALAPTIGVLVLKLAIHRIKWLKLNADATSKRLIEAAERATGAKED